MFIFSLIVSGFLFIIRKVFHIQVLKALLSLSHIFLFFFFALHHGPHWRHRARCAGWTDPRCAAGSQPRIPWARPGLPAPPSPPTPIPPRLLHPRRAGPRRLLLLEASGCSCGDLPRSVFRIGLFRAHLMNSGKVASHARIHRAEPRGPLRCGMRGSQLRRLRVPELRGFPSFSRFPWLPAPARKEKTLLSLHAGFLLQRPRPRCG